MKFLGETVFSTLCTLLNGYVLKTLWAWFVVTTFGLPELHIPAAIGISLLMRLLTFELPFNMDNADSKETTELKPFIGALVTLWVWSVAYVVHLFM